MVFNLTQHVSTPEQGCIEPSDDMKIVIKKWLTFNNLPTKADIQRSAGALVECVRDSRIPKGSSVMVGGAPYLMPALVEMLKKTGYVPVFSFTQRVSEDQTQPDGSVKKVAVFRHEGWIEA